MTYIYNLLHHYAYWILAAVIGLALYSNEHRLNALSVERDIAACHRVNLVRAQSNQIAFQAYHFDTEVQAIIIQPSLLAKLSPKGRQERLDLDAKANIYLYQLGWTPLTNCTNPKPAQEITFRNGTPPQSAFVLGSGN